MQQSETERDGVDSLLTLPVEIVVSAPRLHPWFLKVPGSELLSSINTTHWGIKVGPSYHDLKMRGLYQTKPGVAYAASIAERDERAASRTISIGHTHLSAEEVKDVARHRLEHVSWYNFWFENCQHFATQHIARHILCGNCDINEVSRTQRDNYSALCALPVYRHGDLIALVSYVMFSAAGRFGLTKYGRYEICLGLEVSHIGYLIIQLYFIYWCRRALNAAYGVRKEEIMLRNEFDVVEDMPAGVVTTWSSKERQDRVMPYTFAQGSPHHVHKPQPSERSTDCAPGVDKHVIRSNKGHSASSPPGAEGEMTIISSARDKINVLAANATIMHKLCLAAVMFRLLAGQSTLPEFALQIGVLIGPLIFKASLASLKPPRYGRTPVEGPCEECSSWFRVARHRARRCFEIRPGESLTTSSKPASTVMRFLIPSRTPEELSYFLIRIILPHILEFTLWEAPWPILVQRKLLIQVILNLFAPVTPMTIRERGVLLVIFVVYSYVFLLLFLE